MSFNNASHTVEISTDSVQQSDDNIHNNTGRVEQISDAAENAAVDAADIENNAALDRELREIHKIKRSLCLKQLSIFIYIALFLMLMFSLPLTQIIMADAYRSELQCSSILTPYSWMMATGIMGIILASMLLIYSTVLAVCGQTA